MINPEMYRNAQAQAALTHYLPLYNIVFTLYLPDVKSIN